MAEPVAGFNKNPQNINKKGRPPKGYSITETIRAMMAEKPEIKKALGAKVIEMALKGDITAIKTVWQYMDGMPLQKIAGDSDSDPIGVILYRPTKNANKVVSSPQTGTSTSTDSV